MAGTIDKSDVSTNELLNRLVEQKRAVRRHKVQATSASFAALAALSWMLGAGGVWQIVLVAVALASGMAAYFVGGGHRAVEQDVESRFGNLQRHELDSSPTLDEAKEYLSTVTARMEASAARCALVRNMVLSLTCVLVLMQWQHKHERQQVKRPGNYYLSPPLAVYREYFNNAATQPRVIANTPPLLLQPSVNVDLAMTAAARNVKTEVADLITGTEAGLPEKADAAYDHLLADAQCAKDALASLQNGPFPAELAQQAREQQEELDELVDSVKAYKANPNSASKQALNQQSDDFFTKAIEFLKALGEFIQALLGLLNQITGGSNTGTGVSQSGADGIADAVGDAMDGDSITPAKTRNTEASLKSAQKSVGPSQFSAPFSVQLGSPSTGGTSRIDGILRPLEVPTMARSVKPERGSENTSEKLTPRTTPSAVVPN